MKIQFLLLISLVILSSCSNDTQNNTQISEASLLDHSNPFSKTNNGITVSTMPEPYEFTDAKIKLLSPVSGSTQASGKVKFSFQVDNYTLGNQTPDADSKLCANSAKGQHIHYIIDNEPYKAFYTSGFDEMVFEGYHTVLAFLSRSYHESIKNPDAYVLFNFIAAGKGDLIGTPADLKAPHLFYSRPKGEYIGNDSKKILLDFYLVNTSLSENGNKVRATINGTDFVLPQWKTYIIEGLPMGENTIRLELIDKEGKLVPGPFNDSGMRKFTLSPEEPIIPGK